MPDKISVLLVDDHTLVRRGFRRILEDETDIKVVGEAGDGAEAVKLTDELRPKVIVMDCAMPGMNGLELCRLLADRGPHLPTILMTGRDDDHIKRMMREAKPIASLFKPFDEAVLLRAIRKAIFSAP